MEIKKGITFRFGLIYFSAVLFALVIILKIIYLQTINTERWNKIDADLSNNIIEVPAQRGNLYADDGTLLATSVLYYTVRLNLMKLHNDSVATIFKKNMSVNDSVINLLSKDLSSFFGRTKEEENRFKKRVIEAFKKKDPRFQIDNRKITHAELQSLKKLQTMGMRYFGSALIVIPDDERIQPHGEIASRTIGGMNKGVYGGIHGKVGHTGIEGAMEGYLAGVKGKNILKNYSGKWVPVPLVEPQDGKDIVTTLNISLQDFTHNALKQQMITSQAQWGTAVVMEVKTGEIKAIANIGQNDKGEYAETQNYAVGHASEPGSTFKLMSVIAALEQGKVDTSTVVEVGNGLWSYSGQAMKDSDYGRRSHGNITLKRAFEISSNIGISKAIVSSFGGREKEFINRLNSFGLNRPLDVGFRGEGIPRIKYPGDSDWWGPSLAWIAHGYEILLTPLQTLTFYNAVANNGKMIKPSFVKEIRDNGIVEHKFEPEVLNPSICSHATLVKAQDMLKGVCANGTGKKMSNPHFPVAGKTGTAQIADNNRGYRSGGRVIYQASFVGYFPADEPQYTVIVVISGPQGKYYGGDVAGPVFNEIVDKTYATFLQPRTKPEEDIIKIPSIKNGFRDQIGIVTKNLHLPVNAKKADGDIVRIDVQNETVSVSGISISEGMVPDVKGMGGRDALYILERSGLKVKIKGVGKVRSQSLPAGNKIGENQTIYLELS